MSNQSEFTVITNGIDNKIKIIKHNESGYYNITKVNKLINNNKPKQIKEWFSNKSNIELIEILQNKLNNDKLYFRLKNGIEFQYHGTYVHRYLYDHILMWINKDYAIKCSIASDNIRTLQTNKMDEFIIEQTNKMAEQTNKMAEQTNKMAEQTNKMAEQTKQIDELLGSAKDMKLANANAFKTLRDLRTTLTNLRIQVNNIRK